MNITDQTRISVSEAAALVGQPLSMLETAISRGDLRFVRSGGARRVRTTPAWVNRWTLTSRGR